MHMRRGEWAEAAEVSGIECVGLVKSCPGGEFPVGAKVAALMGGLGSPLGVFCGAFVYLGLEEVVWRNYIQIHSGVLGVLIIMLLLFLPNGLISLRSGMFQRKAKHV